MASWVAKLVFLLYIAAKVDAVWDPHASRPAAPAAAADTASGGDFIVVFKPSASEAQVAQARRAISSSLLGRLGRTVSMGGTSLAASVSAAAANSGAAANLLRMDVIRAPESAGSRADVIKVLESLPGVAYAEVDGIATVQGTQNDPRSW